MSHFSLATDCYSAAKRWKWYLFMPRGDRLKAQDGKLNAVGTRVRERRRSLRLTQDELQGRLGYVTEGRWAVSGQEVLNIERGLRTVLDVELLALAQALECEVLWLLAGNPPTYGSSHIRTAPQI